MNESFLLQYFILEKRNNLFDDKHFMIIMKAISKLENLKELKLFFKFSLLLLKNI